MRICESSARYRPVAACTRFKGSPVVEIRLRSLARIHEQAGKRVVGEFAGQECKLLVRVFDDVVTDEQGEHADANGGDELCDIDGLEMGQLLELGRRAVGLLDEDAVDRENVQVRT